MMPKELFFFQIGCGNSANYANLVQPDWSDRYDLPGIPKDTQWKGVLVDVQPHSIIKMVSSYGDNPCLKIVNVGLGGTSAFEKIESRSLTDVDQEARFISASKYNDKIRPDFKEQFYCHAVTLTQLFTFVDGDIGFLTLDVQGSEVDVLKNYDWIRKPHLIDVESHSENALSIISDILERQGYSFVRRRRDGRRRVNYLWQLKGES